MRFTERGPIIPNELLDARDAGDVVFICGAGVSIPAGLPDFFNLASKVAERLGVAPDSELGCQINAESDRRKSKNSSPVSVGSLSLDQFFTALTRIYGSAQVNAEVVKLLRPRGKAKLNYHRAILDLSRGPDGRQRLITTNFDRLFEKAQARLRSYTPPLFPDLSRSDGFDGVVHLHGQIPEANATRVDDGAGLILTSADFGRAYLAEAWATRFISNLLDRHVVVLLGYSADDPPIRYLLEGLNLSGRIRDKRLFSFAAGEPAQTEAEWRERGVNAIPYDSANGHEFLWDSLHAWAKRARDPGAWRRQIVELAQSSPRSLKSFERGQVVALCSSVEGATSFAAADPHPSAEWLCVFDAYCRYARPGRTPSYDGKTSPEIDPLIEYGLDDDPSNPQQRDQAPPGVDLLAPLKADDPVAHEVGLVAWNSRTSAALNPRLFQISRWILSVMPSPTAVWWAATRNGLHPNLSERLSWALDTTELDLNPVVRKAWRLVLEARALAPERPVEGWWTVQSEIKKEGWTERTIRDFAKATRPHITAKRVWARAPIPPADESSITLSHLAHFDVEYPKLLEQITDVPNETLASAIEVIRHNLELGASLEDEITRIHLKLPTLIPEQIPGHRHYDGREQYYVTFANLFSRLISFDISASYRLKLVTA